MDISQPSRIPLEVRKEVSRWGTCKDEYKRGYNGWQRQLYIREARRMLGCYIITQHHCEGLEVSPDPIGMAAYTMDSHHVQRYVDMNGYVKNEGNVEAPVGKPFPISYRAIVPREDECTNLLVPVCLSSSHIAFGSYPYGTCLHGSWPVCCYGCLPCNRRKTWRTGHLVSKVAGQVDRR